MTGNSGFQVQKSAPRYYDSHVAIFMVPFVETVVNAAVKRGDRILDVACGTGSATRLASIAVGSGGQVVGNDINAAMLSVAKSLPQEEGSGIKWLEASALDLPFADSEFDAVVCQQGIQFFPDVSVGLREMMRVTKDCGRLAASVWAPREDVPYLDALLSTLNEQCEGDVAANAAPYAGGGADEVRSWFVAAGLSEVKVELVEAVVSLPPVNEYVVDHLRALPPPAVGMFFDLDAQSQAKVLQTIDHRLKVYKTTNGFDVPFRSFLATVNC